MKIETRSRNERHETFIRFKHSGPIGTVGELREWLDQFEADEVLYSSGTTGNQRCLSVYRTLGAS